MHTVIMVLSMLTVQYTKRQGIWVALASVFKYGRIANDDGPRRAGRDGKKRLAGREALQPPEVRIPYDFDRVRGPGRVL